MTPSYNQTHDPNSCNGYHLFFFLNKTTIKRLSHNPVYNSAPCQTCIAAIFTTRLMLISQPPTSHEHFLLSKFPKPPPLPSSSSSLYPQCESLHATENLLYFLAGSAEGFKQILTHSETQAPRKAACRSSLTSSLGPELPVFSFSPACPSRTAPSDDALSSSNKCPLDVSWAACWRR